LRHDGTWFLGVGSDHTDREMERIGVAASKAVCPKPIGSTVCRIPDDLVSGEFDSAWDRIEASSSLDGVAYQAGTFAVLRTPSDLLGRLADGGTVADGTAIFAGTLPLLTGEFRYGRTWRLRLTLPDAVLTHEYAVTIEETS
jgi:4-hydroxyphenylacetate 3-monooxygenase